MKKSLIILAICVGEIILLTTCTIYLFFAQEIKNKESVMNRHNTGVVLYDRHGKKFFSFYTARQASDIALRTIPAYVQEAVISSEDKEFYHHAGVSLRGMLRAIFVDIQKNEPMYGGSTITQQLVKNTILSPEKSFLRKYEEIVLASELERRFTKQDILEMYLNSVYFGEGAVGIDNAAHVYFNKSARNLTLAESALLIGLLPAPSALSPFSNPATGAIQHQHTVLLGMMKDGYITSTQEQFAEKQPLHFSQTTGNEEPAGTHFALMVRDLLVKKYGEELIARSGFKVKTSLDSDWQKFAENTVKQQVTNLAQDHVTNGAAVVIDPKTGEILAMVGSVDWNNQEFGKVNMAITPRQPGSSFKPLVYATALEKNIITPATLLRDDPIQFPGHYMPHDYDYKYRGPVSVRRALANSLNIPAVEVMEKLGVSAVLSSATRFGITTLGEDASKYGLSLVLGTGDVSLTELSNVYATFANNGKQYAPTAILEIKNKFDRTVYTYSPEEKKVISPESAFLISSILSDNQTRSEEFGNALTIDRTAAVKTGTSEDYKNALTIGYTPSLVVGVWVGNNNNTSMDNIAGSLGAAPIWKTLMTTFLQHNPDESFIQPGSIVSELVCRSKGLLVRQATSSAYTEYFISGTEPKQDCYGPVAAASLPLPTEWFISSSSALYTSSSSAR